MLSFWTRRIFSFEYGTVLRKEGLAINYTIREMSLNDYDMVFSLWQSTEGIGLSDSDTKENTASYLDRNPALSFVAYLGNKLVGSVLCGHDGRRGYLHHLAVDNRHRGKGIGRALVNASISSLGKHGIQKCNIFLFANNHEAEAFWKHLGWSSIDDVMLMQKIIKASDRD